jgi:hypothetical protein
MILGGSQQIFHGIIIIPSADNSGIFKNLIHQGTVYRERYKK